jgi:hypothetical protein
MWKLVAFVLMLAGFAVLWLTLREKVPFPLSIFGCVACIFLEAAAFATGIAKGTTNPGPHPLVYMWMHGLVAGAAIEGDFIDAIPTSNNGSKVYDMTGDKLASRTGQMLREVLQLRPEPRRMAYFTNDPAMRERLGKNCAGSIDDLLKFAKEYCRVAYAEMLIRENPENAISFTEFQNLSLGEVPDICRMP